MKDTEEKKKKQYKKKGRMQMNELNIIQEQEILGKPFTVYGDFENPLFLAKEVANWIEHNKPSEMLKNVDDDEKIKILINPSDNIVRVLQANTEYWFLTEDGLYEVLMQSRKPIAKQFKKQVKVVLKSIRRYGYYSIKEKEQAEKLGLQKIRAEAMLLNAKNRTFKTLMKSIENKKLSPIAAEVFGLKALESAFGADVSKYLPEIEKTYTAKEVGELLGISANKVGRIANTYELKTAEYGVIVLDKAKNCNKEVEAFRYNQKAVEVIKQLCEEKAVSK